MHATTRLTLGTHIDDRGHLTFAEHGLHLPFAPVRVYFIQNVPFGTTRAGVCHTRMQQVIVAAQGSLDVLTDDGKTQHIHHLNQPGDALLIAPGLWRELGNFSGDALVLVMADMPHDPTEQLKDYEAFKAHAPK